MDTLRIDCNTCSVAGRGCHDCIVGLLLGPPADTGTHIADDDLTTAERRALAIFEAAGMVAPEGPVEVVVRQAPTPIVPLGRRPWLGLLEAQ